MKAYTLHNIALAWTTKINRYTQKEGVELQKMILGMEILLHNIPKFIIMVAAAILLDILPQAMLTWISFAYIRRCAGGLHANNSITCTIMTLLMFVAIPYALQGSQFNIAFFIATFAVVIFGLYKYAPADTAAKPILGEKNRLKLKKQSILSAAIVLAVALIFFDETLYGLIAFGALYALISVLPITYKLLKRSMNNYEQYE